MWRTIIICLFLTGLAGSCRTSGQQGDQALSEELASGARLLDSWPREGPELLWKYEGLGKGYGGACISEEGIFINAEEEGSSYLVCLDRQGTFRWRSPNGEEFVGRDFAATYPGTRSNPRVKGRHVYAISGMGHVSCCDTGTGELIWEVDLVRDFQGIPGDFGYSESPAMDDENVYCFAGGRENNLVALDRLTGTLVWSACLHRDSFSYGTPILLNLPERDVLVGTSKNYIHVVDRSDGTLLSSYRLEDIRVGYEHCNSVVYRDGHVYFVAHEEAGQGTVKLHLSEDGESLEEVWRNNQVLNIFGGFVLVEDCLYTTLENKKLVGLDTNTGEIVHSVRAVSGSIVYADRKLFVYGHNGVLQLFSLKDGAPELKSEMRIRHGSGHHFSFPVIADGVMYIRRGNTLMAYAIR